MSLINKTGESVILIDIVLMV